MCDSVVATGPHTASGRTLFGKNSDRKAGESQPFVQLPEARHPPDARVRCTHIEIPQVAETFRVMGHSPWWVWGFEHGVNEHRVVIGNQAVFSREEPEAEPGLIGMDLVRLALERARSARESVAVISQLLERHGQGGPAFAPGAAGYHNSFMIADPNDAIVLETSGRHWVVREVELEGLSNHISLGAEWSEASHDLESFAREAGWWHSDARIDVEVAYRNPHVPPRLSDGRLRRSRELLARADRALTREHIQSLLRDHGEGCAIPPADATLEDERFFTLCVHHDPPGPTTASMLVELTKDESFAWPTWISFAVPCSGIFLPVYLDGVIPAALAAADEKEERRSAWQVFSRLERAAARDLERNLPLIRQKWTSLEQKLDAQRFDVEQEAKRMAGSGDRDAGADQLSRFMGAAVDEALELAEELSSELI